MNSDIAKFYVLDRERLRLRPIPAGGSDTPPADPAPMPTPTPTPPEPTNEPGDEKTFTQAEVNRMMAREKSQGREAAAREMAEELGVSVEDAKQIIQTHQEQQDAQKTEAQKAKDAADRAKAEADAEKAEAAKDRHNLKVERAIGIIDSEDPEANTSKVAKVARMLDLKVGASEDEIKEAVDGLREEFPALFGTTPEEGGKRKTPPPSSDPGPSPKGSKKQEDAFSRGAERAKQHAGTGGVQYEGIK